MNPQSDRNTLSGSIKEQQELPQLNNVGLPEQYVLLKKLPKGGMGTVYQAQNKYTGLKYAIKVLKAECASDQEAVQRFVIEAQAASLLKHPYICHVHDFGVSQNHIPYLVMDWIEGISLENKINRDGPMIGAEAIQVFEQIAAALEEAHRKQVVHRDLKPDNILLTRNAHDGRTEVRLVDFGIAKVLNHTEDILITEGLTKTGMVVGTPAYMSPEQAKGTNIDLRSDIYSLGCVMYFVLTSRSPFEAATVMDTMYKHVHEAPPEMDPKLNIAPALKTCVLKAIEKNPSDRYQSMGQLSVDLQKLSKGAKLDHRPLASERERSRQRLINIAYFVVGFLVMFALSMGLQGLMGPDSDTQKGSKPARMQTK